MGEVPHVQGAIGAIGALMNRVRQPRPLVVLGLNVWMGTARLTDPVLEAEARAKTQNQWVPHS